jgi:DHA2 family multidrug resistance protein
MFGSTFLLPLYLQNSLGYTAFQAGAMFLPIGLLQAFFSPISGVLSDKVNPKLPAIIGIVLLGISLYLNSSLSLFSERQQIMMPLLMRGVAMGLLFTPLTTLALSRIPKHKIAQASGLFNVIRQLGGSFGVAIMGALLTRRMLYHSAMYGQMVDQQSAMFQQVTRNLARYSQQMLGGTTSYAAMRAKAAVVSHVMQQSFVQAVCDDFLIAAVITMIGVFPILLLRTRKQKAGEHVAAVE